MLEFVKIMLAGKTKSENGATAVEYGLLVALIAAVIILVVGFLGQDVLGGFNTVEDNINGDQA
ncbi:Flp family type IVb pilin [Nocardioides donggukensis]|uniref:Flp family type IVb pilin n=1 Tax=Nocardioides donggukensis TaxID=2774019 RepID=A0A927K303_9ACTN|nr:Flp family type IVb pilin [Nocardioides donggukensis]MBD8869149.1 Flp family type IVb pilin [Nocardioides donggukensis]